MCDFRGSGEQLLAHLEEILQFAGLYHISASEFKSALQDRRKFVLLGVEHNYPATATVHPWHIRFHIGGAWANLTVYTTHRGYVDYFFIEPVDSGMMEYKAWVHPDVAELRKALKRYDCREPNCVLSDHYEDEE